MSATDSPPPSQISILKSQILPPLPLPAAEPLLRDLDRVRPSARGKFLFTADRKFYIKGVTYGPFRPEPPGSPHAGSEYHTPADVEADFARIAAAGFNSLRCYTVPPRWLLDIAMRHALRVMVGLPWEQHVSFLDDPRRAADIVARARQGAASCAAHPALLAYAVGNEIPAAIVRWYGRRRIETFILRLCDEVRQADPAAMLTYVNYPSTEYLGLPFLDFLSFNVYLESPEKLEPYLAKLQTVAADRPLLIAELGLDSVRNGPEKQASTLAWQLRSVLAAGSCGAFVFSWTDEWFRGGYDIDDWGFGLTTRARAPKPALASVAAALADVPFPLRRVSQSLRHRLHFQPLRHPPRLPHRPRRPRLPRLRSHHRRRRLHRLHLRNRRRIPLPVDPPKSRRPRRRPQRRPRRRHRLHRRLHRRRCPPRHPLAHLSRRHPRLLHRPRRRRPQPRPLQRRRRRQRNRPRPRPGHPRPPHGPPRRAPPRLQHGLLAPAPPRSRRLRPALPHRRRRCRSLLAHPRRRRALAFSPAAVVWHHPRNSLAAYWRQQYHYGNAEALLERKWPQRYSPSGHLVWQGRLYARAFIAAPRRIYHGIWGSAAFQSLYQLSPAALWSIPALPEWYLAAGALGLLALLGIFFHPLLWAWLLVVLALSASAAVASLSASALYLPPPLRYLRPKIAFLYFIQPAARMLGRLRLGLTPLRQRGVSGFLFPRPLSLSFWSDTWRSSEDRVAAVETALKHRSAAVLRGGPFDRHDLHLRGGLFASARCLLAVEEHGGGKQLIRMRLWPLLSTPALITLILCALLTFVSALFAHPSLALFFLALFLIIFLRSLQESAAAMATLRRAFT